MKKNLIIFDTTLSEINAKLSEKIKIAQHLDKLGVDVIQIGKIHKEKKTIEKISKQIEKPILCVLSRCLKSDIKQADESLKCKKRRINLFIPTSDVLIKNKLKMTKEEVLKKAVQSVDFAKEKFDDIQFTFEDATRTD